jgi:hypothetical protein
MEQRGQRSERNWFRSGLVDSGFFGWFFLVVVLISKVATSAGDRSLCEGQNSSRAIFCGLGVGGCWISGIRSLFCEGSDSML